MTTAIPEVATDRALTKERRADHNPSFGFVPRSPTATTASGASC